MRVAVLSLTRDRLDYTKHCFQSLREKAGCEYDHYVLDQGSGDGTVEWLHEWEGVLPGGEWRTSIYLPRNVGICRGLNVLLATALLDDYDVIVKVDPDCEVATFGALEAAAHACLELNMLISPRINGLLNPPPFNGITHRTHDGVEVGETGIIGGIFLAAPARLFTEYGYRHNEENAVWEGDDRDLCMWALGEHNIRCGYLLDYEANHYRGTAQQWEDHPDYWARKRAEGLPA